MKRALCLTGILAGVAAACAADIDLFLTRQSDASTYVYPGNRFNQNVTKINMLTNTPDPGTLSHGPFYLGGATPASPVIATFYVWAHIHTPLVYDTDDDGVADMPVTVQVHSLGLQASSVSGAATIGPSATYRQFVGSPYRRWENTDPLPFPSNAATSQQTLLGGIGAPPSADPLTQTWDSGNNTPTDWYCLVGAFQYTATGESSFYFGVGNPVPFIGVRYFDADGNIINDWNGPGTDGYYPDLTVMGQPYTYAANTQPLLAITSAPEPASLGLLAVIGLLIRRR